MSKKFHKKFYKKVLSEKERNIERERDFLLYIRHTKKKRYELCFPNFFSVFFPKFRKSSKRGLKYKTKRSLIKDRRIAVKKLLLRMEAARNNISVDSSKSHLLPNGKKSKLKFFFGKVLTIRVKPNNVFCTFVNKVNQKTISGTSTKYKVKMSKKALRYNYKVILKSFLKETKRFLKSKRILVSITSPKRIRRELVRTLKTRLIKRKKFVRKASGKIVRYSPDLLLFRFNSKKCFNGCRVRKKRRKKQRGLRIYK